MNFCKKTKKWIGFNFDFNKTFKSNIQVIQKTFGNELLYVICYQQNNIIIFHQYYLLDFLFFPLMMELKCKMLHIGPMILFLEKRERAGMRALDMIEQYQTNRSPFFIDFLGDV